MSQAVIDLEKYDIVAENVFRNKITGRHYTPRQRNGRVELAPVIIQQRYIEAAPVRLQIAAPGEIEEKSEITRSVSFDKPLGNVTERKPLSEAQKVFIPAFIIMGLVTIFFSLAKPMAVPHVAQPVIPAQESRTSQGFSRISQLDPGQYASQSERDTWSGSTCNVAVVTMIVDAYGGNLKITNVLQIELRLGVISASEGLLSNDGIDATARSIGFDTETLDNPTIDQVVARANAGNPIMIDLPPQPGWPSGHFMTLIGGDDQNVKLADPWETNWTTVSREKFLRYWRGFAKVLTPSRYSFLQGKPTLSVDQVNAVLVHSPAHGEGQDIYNLSQQYGVDDAYILATFAHESGLGTAGEAVRSLSPGNLRCADWMTWGWCQENYEFFHSWSDGFKSLYLLLSGSYYEGEGHTTPDSIIPRFAPSSDNNNEGAYIDSLKRSIDVLRSGGTSF